MFVITSLLTVYLRLLYNIDRATDRNVPRSAELQVSFREGAFVASACYKVTPFFTAAFRAQQGEVMRMACRLDPRTGFQMAGEWLKYQLTAPVDTGPMNCKFFGKVN